MTTYFEAAGATSYPGRGIMAGKTADGKKAVFAYFIMGRSENSRNRIFVEEGQDMKTHPFDASKVEDPSLIIYAPVRVVGNNVIVTNGDQTDTIRDFIAEGTACNRFFYEYVPQDGLGHFIHTYVCDGNPIPTFQGEPERVKMEGAIDEFTNMLWENLNENNKISLYVRYIDLATGEVENRLINKHQ